MGFFDCNCMLTGVDLNYGGTVAIILRKTPEGYEPISHGISGTYDRLGTIDGVDEDAGTQLVLDYFVQQHRGGRFVGRWHTGKDDDYVEAIDDIEVLLGLCERTGTMSDEIAEGYLSPMAALDNDAIVHALISKPIWDAIAAAGAEEPSLEAAFGGARVPHEIYGARLSEIEAHLRAMAAVRTFVDNHQLRWATTGEPDQRYPTEMGGQLGSADALVFLADARRDYRDSPVALAGLDAYEVHLRDWIDHYE